MARARHVLLAVAVVAASPATAHDPGDTLVLLQEIEQSRAAGFANEPPSAAAKAILAYKLRWAPGSDVHVCMWHADQTVRALIAKVAREWLAESPNLTLNFGDLSDPRQCKSDSKDDIRVGDYAPKPGENVQPFSSQIGTQARGVEQPYTTMNLNFDSVLIAAAKAADQTGTRALFHFYVLHEFGHALGAWHEHQWGSCARHLTAQAASLVFPGTPAATANANLTALTASDIHGFDIHFLTVSEDPQSVMRYNFADGVYDQDAPAWCSHADIRSLSPGDVHAIRLAYPRPGDPPQPNTTDVATLATTLASDSRLSDQARQQATRIATVWGGASAPPAGNRAASVPQDLPPRFFQLFNRDPP